MTGLIFLLATILVYAHTGRMSSAPHTEVYVKDCSDQYVAIYADSKLTNPLPNPLISGPDGYWEYFSTNDSPTEEQVYVFYQGKLVAETTNCPVREWGLEKKETR